MDANMTLTAHKTLAMMVATFAIWGFCLIAMAA